MASLTFMDESTLLVSAMKYGHAQHCMPIGSESPVALELHDAGNKL